MLSSAVYVNLLKGIFLISLPIKLTIELQESFDLLCLGAPDLLGKPFNISNTFVLQMRDSLVARLTCTRDSCDEDIGFHLEQLSVRLHIPKLIHTRALAYYTGCVKI
jgi:hypothetical protein